MAVLLLGVLLVLALVAFLAVTRAGTQVLFQNAQRFVPELELEGADGVLATGLTLDKLRWRMTAPAWKPAGLNSNTFDVGTFHLAHRQPASRAAGSACAGK